jgi:hypothetical protein
MVYCPFMLQGLDTDCASEFINYDLLDYCEDNHITFTRARTHRKYDQAHVEEKNGSVVRRLVGYERFDEHKAWTTLAQFYRVQRVYVNFFQPSLKSLNEERKGCKVSKKYASAKTPFQRILLSENVDPKQRKLLTTQYESLVPIAFTAQLQAFQDELWKYAWQKNSEVDTSLIVTKKDISPNFDIESEVMSIVIRH